MVDAHTDARTLHDSSEGIVSRVFVLNNPLTSPSGVTAWGPKWPTPCGPSDHTSRCPSTPVAVQGRATIHICFSLIMIKASFSHR